MKIVPQFAALTAILSALLFSTVVNAAAVDNLTEIVASCTKPDKDPVQCEKDYWAFVDVTADGHLTVAEITRAGRIFAEHMRQTTPPENNGKTGGKTEDNLLFAMLLGPLAAQLVISNFDYDGDLKVSRKELYTDLPEGKFESVIDRLALSGNKAIADAMGLMLGLSMKNQGN